MGHKKDRNVPTISESEWVVMRALWDRSPRSLSEIVDVVTEQRAWNKKTVQTLVGRLVKKGAVGVRKTKPRNHTYYARTKEDRCKRSEVNRFLDRIFDGDMSSMLSHVVQSDGLSSEQITALKNILEEAE